MSRQHTQGDGPGGEAVGGAQRHVVQPAPERYMVHI